MGSELVFLVLVALIINRTPEALKVTEPRAFGFNLDYVPIENL